MDNNTCPSCGSREFITEPNQYDVLTFEEGDFRIVSVEQTDNFKIYCRECAVEVVKGTHKSGVSLAVKELE